MIESGRSEGENTGNTRIESDLKGKCVENVLGRGRNKEWAWVGGGNEGRE